MLDIRVSLQIARSFGVSFAWLILGFASISSSAAESSRFEQTYDRTYFAKDPDLGYGLMRDARAVRSIKKLRGGEQLYDVVYTIDKGIRLTPFGTNGPPVFFFGDSFTAGEGVGDADTLPAQFSRASDRRSFNFGVSGYGPHQFLRMLEIRKPEEIAVGAKPQFVVYTLVPGHVDRAAGRSAWDKTGPFYNIAGSSVEYRGPFNSTMKNSAAEGLLGSRISNLLPSFTSTEDTDRNRVLAILKKSRSIIEEKYGAKMLIVLWDRYPGMSKIDISRAAWFQSQLRADGVPTIIVSELTPPPIDKNYYIPFDGHPKPQAYGVVGRAIAEFVKR